MNNEQKLRIAGARAVFFLLERKYKEGLREWESLPDDLLTSIPAALCGKYYLIGFARKALQDETGARVAFLKAKDLLEAQLKQSPDAADMHIQLAKVLAYLGQKDAALAEARRAAELLPESKDAFGGPEIAAGVAEVYCIVGVGSAAKRSAVSGFARQIRCESLARRSSSFFLRRSTRALLGSRKSRAAKPHPHKALSIDILSWKIPRPASEPASSSPSS